MSDIEIEIQVKIENCKPLLEFLNKKGKFEFEKRQIDEYFSPTHNSFLNTRPIKEWLRLRDAGGVYSINYKNWHFDETGKSHYCDEYESEIEDPQQLKKILNALDFQKIVEVDKVRSVWLFEEYEISIDSIKELGDFVEIEFKGKDTKVNPETITEEMIELLKKIGCGKIKRNYVGYPFQLLFPKEVTHEIQ